MPFPKRIMINDFAGHPFSLQLGQSLANRGYPVLYSYCASHHGPHGVLDNRAISSSNLKIYPIYLRKGFDKYSLITRFRQEQELGKKIYHASRFFQTDLVFSANTPLVTHATLLKLNRLRTFKYVYWLQDRLGFAIHQAVRHKLGYFGDIFGRYFEYLENRLLINSDHVIIISNDFLTYLPEKVIVDDKVTLIHNWAPLEDLPLGPKVNAWSQAHGLDNQFCFLYAGTLGLKHNPDILVQLAIALAGHESVKVVVISEGIGSEYLHIKKNYYQLNNLIIMGFQPFQIMPDVLATADVLLAILEPEAGVFSVPSKILSYLCASRPILMAVPFDNLAASIINSCDAGIVVPPHDCTAFVREAQRLIQDSDLRVRLGQNGRSYAERFFDIERISDRFEDIISQLNIQIL